MQIKISSSANLYNVLDFLCIYHSSIAFNGYSLSPIITTVPFAWMSWVAFSACAYYGCIGHKYSATILHIPLRFHTTNYDRFLQEKLMPLLTVSSFWLCLLRLVTTDFDAIYYTATALHLLLNFLFLGSFRVFNVRIGLFW